MIVYGVLADDGTQLFRLHQKFNGDIFLKYLKDIWIFKNIFVYSMIFYKLELLFYCDV